MDTSGPRHSMLALNFSRSASRLQLLEPIPQSLQFNLMPEPLRGRIGLRNILETAVSSSFLLNPNSSEHGV